MAVEAAITDGVVDITTDGGVGESAARPDAEAKARGSFAFASDLTRPDALVGLTLRCPHPRARVVAIDTTRAKALPGVRAVLTHHDVPGEKYFGLERRDQPVLVVDEARYHGEPVALVAAVDRRTARQALDLINVTYERLEPVTDPLLAARDASAPAVHPGGNVVRRQRIRRGDPDAVTADVVVRGEYVVGMQDQAFLGPESGLAVPLDDGGVHILVATQWLHVDQDQVAPCLGLPKDRVTLELAGVGGAFGAREDLSMQIHASMLALATGSPVRMVYDREESFLGHVHRHPAVLRYEHGADSEGRLVYVRADVVLDGGAYASSTTAVVGNAASLGVGPYDVPHVAIEVTGVYTNNPPCGAMRGFGAVQACFAYESQMNRLADAVGVDPVEIRHRNAMRDGSALPTGQPVRDGAPVAELLDLVRGLPLPPPSAGQAAMPGGTGDCTRPSNVTRGVGYAVGIKNICYSEGFDDYSTASVRVFLDRGQPAALVRTAAAEVGQGIHTVVSQIVQTELGVDRVLLGAVDTASVGSAGSTSASRQSYMTGGAVLTACEAVRAELIKRAAQLLCSGDAELSLRDGHVVDDGGDGSVAVADLVRNEPVECLREYHHRPTTPLDPGTGQGRSHTQLAVCAHRAVVDVDVELGLVKVVELAAAQDVGRVLNRRALEGQIHGASVQGLGLATLEELRVHDGHVLNPSFTDYLIPTCVDAPSMPLIIVESADPEAPYGLRGAGEPATLSSTPAIVAAIGVACGRHLTRVPVRPDDIALGSKPAEPTRATV